MNEAFTPLPERLRPRSLDEVVGQRHVLAEGKLLRVAVESGNPEIREKILKLPTPTP